MLDFFMHSKLRDDGVIYNRALLLICVLCFSVVVIGLFVFINLFHELYHFMTLNMIVLISVLICLILLKYLGNYSAASFLYVIVLNTCFFYNLLMSGGLNSTLLIWTPVVIGLLLYLIRFLHGFIIVSFFSTTFLILSYLQTKGMTHIQEFIFTEEQIVKYRWINFIVATIGSVILFKFYDTMKGVAYKQEFAAKKEKQNLIAILCHDVVNPLGLIVGLTEEKIENVEEYPEAFNMIRKASRIVLEIIDSVREVQAIESGKKKIDFHPVKVQKLVEKARFVFGEKLKEKNLTLKYEGEDGFEVFADEVILSNNVINNLVSNAIKFSLKNSNIVIKSEKIDGKGVIQILDSGVGMPDELTHQLFSMEAITSRLGTDGEKGTGFGMPLVHACVKKFNGSIAVQSLDIKNNPLNHGTSFTLRLELPPLAS